MNLLIVATVCAILVWIAVEDARRFRIGNGAVILLALAFPVDCLLRGRTGSLAPHALFAALALTALFAAFLMRIVGAGDAKFLAAALLWVGPEGCTLFSLALLASTVVYATGAWIGWLPCRRVGQRTAIPFGTSIAAAWLVYVAATLWVELIL